MWKALGCRLALPVSTCVCWFCLLFFPYILFLTLLFSKWDINFLLLVNFSVSIEQTLDPYHSNIRAPRNPYLTLGWALVWACAQAPPPLRFGDNSSYSPNPYLHTPCFSSCTCLVSLPPMLVLSGGKLPVAFFLLLTENHQKSLCFQWRWTKTPLQEESKEGDLGCIWTGRSWSFLLCAFRQLSKASLLAGGGLEPQSSGSPHWLP